MRNITSEVGRIGQWIPLAFSGRLKSVAGLFRRIHLKLWLSTLAVLASGLALAQAGWKKPEAIVAAVNEWRQDSTRSFQVYSHSGALRVSTTIGVNGALEGMPRIESISPKGVFTWLEDKPGVAMQLLTPTAWEPMEFLAVPRFSRADLEFHLAGIERALGKKVLAGAHETIAGRECLVLTILDRPTSLNQDYQKLWIDRETGIAMKIEEYFKGQMTYSRSVTSIEFLSEPPGVDMLPRQDALMVRGPVSANALLRIPTPRPVSEFAEEIARFNATSKSDEKNWLIAPAISSPFGYVHSSYREPVVMAQRSQHSNPNEQSRRETVSLFDAPTMISSPSGGSAQFVVSVSRSDDGGSREIQVQAEINGERREFIVRQGEDGRGLTFPPTGGQSQRTQSNEPASVRMYVAKSDFVDPKTGKTLALVQAQGVPPENYLDGILLTRSSNFDDTRFPSARLFFVEIPYEALVLTWQKGKVRYAIAATGLTASELADIAARVK